MEFLYDIFDVSVPQGLIESMSTPFGKRKQILQVEAKQ